MGQKAQNKSEQTNYDRQKNFIYQALQQMSPENIAQLMKMFLPKIMAAQSGMAQTSLHQLQRVQANKGIAQSPISASQQLGLTSSMSNQAQQQAFMQAMGLAQQRAGAWSGQPAQTQPNYNMTNAWQTGMQQAILAAALQNRNKSQQVPYDMGGAPWTKPGWKPEPIWGLPPEYEPKLF